MREDEGETRVEEVGEFEGGGRKESESGVKYGSRKRERSAVVFKVGGLRRNPVIDCERVQ